MATADVCRRHGISSATVYKWKSKCGGLEASEARRLRARRREREAEEAAGRGDAGQRGAEGSGIKKMVTPGAKLEAVAHAREYHGLSERRACNLVGVSRRVIRYRSLRPDDGPLRQRLRELAAERRRFSYRRLGYLLAREGMTPNHKKLLRVYREENLRVRRRGGRKRALVPER
ncbi:putative transposase [Sphingobium sp. B8D3C]|nr:putative transposase [Sphingobium sp. B8D3B]MCW2420154.1 putative transposase [Sphingobium sp. B8D3C]